MTFRRNLVLSYAPLYPWGQFYACTSYNNNHRKRFFFCFLFNSIGEGLNTSCGWHTIKVKTQVRVGALERKRNIWVVSVVFEKSVCRVRHRTRKGFLKCFQQQQENKTGQQSKAERVIFGSRTWKRNTTSLGVCLEKGTPKPTLCYAAVTLCVCVTDDGISIHQRNARG